jgi:hypothetical protein
MKNYLTHVWAILIFSFSQAQNHSVEIQQFFENQNSPFTSALDESYLIDSIIWTRPYGEKFYHLSPAVPNVLVYESQIHNEAEMSAFGLEGAKFQFAEVEVNDDVRLRLRDFHINVPDYAGYKVIVYLPNYQLNQLVAEGVSLLFLNNYGTNEPINFSPSQSYEKATIWSEGFETALGYIPGTRWEVAIDAGVTNCGWSGRSCLKKSGNWSAYCAGSCSLCDGYSNNMSAQFFNKSNVNTSGYVQMGFNYWINLDLYNIGSNDEFKRYEKLGNSSWTLKASYNSSSSIDGSGWRELSTVYSGISFPSWASSFYFYSNSIGTSEGVYLDDLRLTGTLPMDVENENLEFDLQIFPNPSDGQISIFHEYLEGVTLSTVEGKEVGSIQANQGQVNADFQLSPGIYFAHCRLSNHQIVTRKMVIH